MQQSVMHPHPSGCDASPSWVGELDGVDGDAHDPCLEAYAKSRVHTKVKAQPQTTLKKELPAPILKTKQ